MSIDSGGTLEETVQAESQGMLAEFVTHIQARQPAGTALFPAAPTVSACPPVRSARPGAGRRSRAPAARRAELALPAPGAQGGGPGGARCRGVPPPAACVRLRASLAGTAAAEARCGALPPQFGLRTVEAISRVQALEAMGRITGVMDERGKFVYISLQEMETVAAYIRSKGRVSIAELAHKSNDFIDLAKASAAQAAAKAADLTALLEGDEDGAGATEE